MFKISLQSNRFHMVFHHTPFWLIPPFHLISLTSFLAVTFALIGSFLFISFVGKTVELKASFPLSSFMFSVGDQL